MVSHLMLIFLRIIFCLLYFARHFSIGAGDIKASVAGLRFILSSAAKHDVDGATLGDELQQLGLPKGR